MPLLGLIGYPLSHSFSPEYFTQKFRKLQLTDWDYKLFPIRDIQELKGIIAQNEDLAGLNVTIPHKLAVLSFCDELSEEVQAIGAANLIKITRADGAKPKLTAHNTDFFGFMESLQFWYEGEGKALVLGTGGVSKAVQYALKKMKINFDLANREAILGQTFNLTGYSLIINCTPVGMMRNGSDFENELLPLPYDQVNYGHYFYDLIYNPAETAMMKRFSEKGARVKNGLEMLHLQAEKTWEIVGNNNG